MFGRKLDDKLLDAAFAGDQGVVREVLYRKADLVNMAATRSICRHRAGFDEGDTPLHLAARGGHQPVVELLLSLKASTNASNVNGATPLHFAAACGQSRVAQLLMENRADSNSRDGNGRTPLHEAALGGHAEVQQALMDHDARPDIKDRSGNTALHEAARASCEQLVRLLAGAGLNVNDRNNQDRTPLHMAVIGADHGAASQVNQRRKATTQTVKLLLTLGADANAVDTVGETPLDVLSYLEGDVQTDPVVQVLRESGGRWVRYGHRHTNEEPARPQLAAKTIVGVRTTTASAPREASTHVGQTSIELGSTPVTIGRSVECDIRYRSLTLSRRHTRIEPHRGGYAIVDLGSHNGTLVDGERISRPHMLERGEVITLGAYEFNFDGHRIIPNHGELSEEELRGEKQRVKS